MGPCQNFLAHFGLAIFVLGMELENFPLKCQIFQFFALRVKKKLSGGKVPGSEPGRPLIYYGSKVCSGRIGSEPISSANYKKNVNNFKIVIHHQNLLWFI